MGKKAQLRIQEMAFMIVAVFLFFILIGLFVLSIFYINIQKQATIISEAQTLSSITNLAGAPELICVNNKVNCVDSDKLMALTNNKNYKNYWAFSSLRVVKLSGFSKSEDEMERCSLGNYPNCDMFIVYDKNVGNEKLISSFVALCRNEYEEGNYDKCEIAKLIAGSEVKG